MNKSLRLIKMVESTMNQTPSKFQLTSSSKMQKHGKGGSRQTFSLQHSSDSVSLAANQPESLVVIGKKARRVTILRYILSKVVYKEKIAVRDILAIFACILDCQNLAQRDPNFKKKFGLALEATARLIKGVKFGRHIDERLLNSLRRAILNIPEGFIYPKRNLPQLRTKVEGQYHLHYPKKLGVPVKSLPPKLWVGKGYSDKGTARNPALDGSPSWQEVAMDRRNV